ncbi:MAG: hypothetical protein LC770_10515, partial [Acidobacteria bacterium]|nr:hypothetical protein [Acidobacteriota bacterium]
VNVMAECFKTNKLEVRTSRLHGKGLPLTAESQSESQLNCNRLKGWQLDLEPAKRGESIKPGA